MTFRLSHITKKVNEPNDNKHSVTDHIHRSYFEQSSARPGQGQKKHEEVWQGSRFRGNVYISFVTFELLPLSKMIHAYNDFGNVIYIYIYI